MRLFIQKPRKDLRAVFYHLITNLVAADNTKKSPFNLLAAYRPVRNLFFLCECFSFFSGLLLCPCVNDNDRFLPKWIIWNFCALRMNRVKQYGYGPHNYF